MSGRRCMVTVLYMFSDRRLRHWKRTSSRTRRDSPRPCVLPPHFPPPKPTPPNPPDARPNPTQPIAQGMRRGQVAVRLDVEHKTRRCPAALLQRLAPPDDDQQTSVEFDDRWIDLCMCRSTLDGLGFKNWTGSPTLPTSTGLWT